MRGWAGGARTCCAMHICAGAGESARPKTCIAPRNARIPATGRKQAWACAAAEAKAWPVPTHFHAPGPQDFKSLAQYLQAY